MQRRYRGREGSQAVHGRMQRGSNAVSLAVEAALGGGAYYTVTGANC